MVAELVALAHERRVPVLIHAGRGIPALGQNTVRLAERYPEARLILAHAAISDLAWLWRVLPEHPNVFIDTAWWNPTDLVALFALAPPASVLFASDSPYGRPVAAAVMALRCALQAGLTAEQVRGVAGGTLTRMLDGASTDELALGPAPGQPSAPLDLLLERVVVNLCTASGGSPARPIRPSRSPWRGCRARSASTGRTPTSSPRCSRRSTTSRPSAPRPS